MSSRAEALGTVPMHVGRSIKEHSGMQGRWDVHALMRPMWYA